MQLMGAMVKVSVMLVVLIFSGPKTADAIGTAEAASTLIDPLSLPKTPNATCRSAERDTNVLAAAVGESSHAEWDR